MGAGSTARGLSLPSTGLKLVNSRSPGIETAIGRDIPLQLSHHHGLYGLHRGDHLGSYWMSSSSHQLHDSRKNGIPDLSSLTESTFTCFQKSPSSPYSSFYFFASFLELAWVNFLFSHFSALFCWDDPCRAKLLSPCVTPARQGPAEGWLGSSGLAPPRAEAEGLRG
jgi:hypothetical protein